MRNLIGFLIRYNFILLFLFLETISFILIYQTSYYQRHTMISSANSVTGGLNAWYSGVTEYLLLKSENQILAEENARLRSVSSPETTRSAHTGTSQAGPKFNYQEAKVVSNTIHKRSNYFMINKGSNDGIKIDMGVMSSGGVAGIIVGVSKKYALGMSLLHKDSRISGRIKKNNQLVNITWPGNHFTTGLVMDIPTHVALSKGDTIITSGNSLIFPEGLLIGVIDQYYVNENALFNTADMRFETDFNSLYYVYITDNLDKNELQELIPLREE